jgi:DNA-binding transcriptional LysR family regulator
MVVPNWNQCTMWSLDDLRALDAVIREGNFSEASRKLGVTRSAVSKAVRRIEDALGAQMFFRNTHNVRPTDTARQFHARAMEALEIADDATEMVRAGKQTAKGNVRISLPTSLGFAYLSEALPDLLEAHPGLQVDVALTDRRVDLFAEGFDIALRLAATGQLLDSDLLAQKLASGAVELCASPSWIQENGQPDQVADLAELPCIWFAGAFDQERKGFWDISDASAPQGIHISGPVRSDSGLALRAAVLGGAGIALLPRFLVARPIKEERLVRLLPGAKMPRYSVYALRPPGTYLNKATETVVNSLRNWLASVEI